MTTHGMGTETLRQETYILEDGLYIDAPAPCCVWGKFESIVIVTVDLAVAATKGTLDVFTLYTETTDKILKPSDKQSIAFGVINTNLAAGLVTRMERQYNGGINGIRITNLLGIRIPRLSVRWVPSTLHIR